MTLVRAVRYDCNCKNGNNEKNRHAIHHDTLSGLDQRTAAMTKSEGIGQPLRIDAIEDFGPFELFVPAAMTSSV